MKLIVQRKFELLSGAFSESIMSRTQDKLWYKWFMEGWEDVNEKTRPGRPRMTTTDENIEENDFWIIVESL